MATGGFSGRRRGGAENSGRLPPGQYLTEDFPVLSAGPTARRDPARWRSTLKVGPKPVKSWDWAAFNRLPMSNMTRDIHCVTQWSRFDTHWRGVIVDDLLVDAGHRAADVDDPAPCDPQGDKRLVLLASARTAADLPYLDELEALDRCDPAFMFLPTLTREPASASKHRAGRIDRPLLAQALAGISPPQLCFVCGSNAFLESIARLLLDLDVPSQQIRTERYGG